MDCAFITLNILGGSLLAHRGSCLLLRSPPREWGPLGARSSQGLGWHVAVAGPAGGVSCWFSSDISWSDTSEVISCHQALQAGALCLSLRLICLFLRFPLLCLWEPRFPVKSCQINSFPSWPPCALRLQACCLLHHVPFFFFFKLRHESHNRKPF